MHLELKANRSNIRNAPLRTRIFWYLKRYTFWLLDRHRRSSMLETGYLIIDNVDSPGVQMLSQT